MTIAKPADSTQRAPSTGARPVGVFLILFSLLHFFSFFYLLIYHIQFPASVKAFAHANGYTIREIFESIPVLRGIELVMSVALLLLGLAYLLAGTWQVKKDYRGVRLDKALRITGLTLNGLYALLLVFADEVLLYSPEFDGIMTELKEILGIYTIMIFVLVAVLLFGLIKTFRIFKRWGDRAHFPQHFPPEDKTPSATA